MICLPVLDSGFWMYLTSPQKKTTIASPIVIGIRLRTMVPMLLISDWIGAKVPYVWAAAIKGRAKSDELMSASFFV